MRLFLLLTLSVALCFCKQKKAQDYSDSKVYFDYKLTEPQQKLYKKIDGWRKGFKSLDNEIAEDDYQESFDKWLNTYLTDTLVYLDSFRCSVRDIHLEKVEDMKMISAKFEDLTSHVPFYFAMPFTALGYDTSWEKRTFIKLKDNDNVYLSGLFLPVLNNDYINDDYYDPDVSGKNRKLQLKKILIVARRVEAP